MTKNNNKTNTYELALYAILDCHNIASARRIAVEALQVDDPLEEVIEELDFETDKYND